MESLIKLSKRLTERLLNGKTPTLDKEYFYMFSVSKFILLKESLLKKGKVKISETEEATVLYFDNDKNEQYIPIIHELYNYIIKHGTFSINKNDRVSLTKKCTDKNDLVCALWIMNKLRDSIAHGKYSFDFKNEKIVINNEGPDGSYSLKCSIPLHLLNKISFFIEKIKNSEEMVVKYDKNLQSGYKTDLKEKYPNYVLNDYHELDSLSSKQMSKNKNKYLTPQDGKILSEMYSNELSKLMIQLTHYHPKNKYEAKRTRRILSESKYIITHKEQLEKQRDNYDKKTKSLIEEIRELLGIKHKNRVMDAVPALYNYMCLSFSVEPEIDYSYLSTKGLDISFDKNYQLIIYSIQKICIKFNTSLEILIKQYNKYPNQQFRHKLIKMLLEFYNDIISKYYIRNKTITTSIRNSIEHGNISIEDDNIILVDLPNQRDKNTIKFTCAAPAEALFKFTNQVNNRSLKETYTLNDFFYELHKIIPDDLYKDIINRLDDLSNIAFGKKLDTSKSMRSMYYESLANAINMVSRKVS